MKMLRLWNRNPDSDHFDRNRKAELSKRQGFVNRFLPCDRFTPFICSQMIIALVMASQFTHGADSQTGSGRIAWDQSAVIGFPDTPPPYRVKQRYPDLELNNPLSISRLPGTRDLLVHAHKGGYGGPGSLLRFAQDDQNSDPEEFLVIGEIIYGVAFHPEFEKNGWMYVGCNGRSAEQGKICTKVLRFHVDRKAPYRCDPESRVTVIEWPSNGHNGGDLAFGNDGMLYVSAGDGTSDSDANRAGQDLSTLPGSMLRIDVDQTEPGQTYSIPQDNPFLEIPDARPEIWAYGLRNPWRISVDSRTGDLWAGINGQDLWETAQVVRRGENYGWSITEGSHPFITQQPRGPTPIITPTIEHPHSEARSLTGGHVYYGDRNKELRGHYIYGDYSTGMIWAAKYEAGEIVSHFVVARSQLQIAGFGMDHDGELVIVDYGGGLYELAPNPQEKSDHFPKLLSQTGIYTSIKDHQVHPGLIPYTVNSPLWSDGAAKERFIGIPGTQSIEFKPNNSWEFPDGTVLVKTFSLPVAKPAPTPADASSMRRIETRLMTRQGGEWFGYSYRWNPEQSDASLVAAEGHDEDFDVYWKGSSGSATKQTWHYPSRSECMVCHSRASNYVLGLSAQQTNLTIHRGGRSLEQLEFFRQLGLFKGAVSSEANPNSSEDSAASPGGDVTAGSDFHFPRPLDELPRLANPKNPEEPLEARVRAYLHSNCANCHVKEGGGNSKLVLTANRPLEKTGLIGVKPLHDTFGLSDAEVIKAKAPDQSVLLERLKRRGPGQMPPLATRVVDAHAIEMIKSWIESLPSENQSLPNE